MTRLDVSVELAHSLVREVAPLVEGVTNWTLDAGALVIRVLPRDRGYEEIVLRRLEAAGVLADDGAPRGIVERMVEHVLEHNVAGAYEPSRGELMLVRENVDDSNLDGLRLVVAHELVHRGQHLNHPELFARLDSATREAFDLMESNRGGFRAVLDKVKEVQSIMTLLESHAVYVQETLRKTHFPQASIETHHGLTALLFRFLAGAKVEQYREGIPQVAEAVASGTVDSLFAKLKSV